MTIKDLTQDEQETLELLISEHWPVIMKVLAVGVQQQRDAVLGHNIQSEADGFQMIRLRSQLAGAESLEMFMTSLKRKKDKKEQKNGR